MKILVADAHASRRAGLVTAARRSDCTVIAETGDGPSALVAFVDCQPDIALLAVDLPGLSGGATANNMIADGEHAVVVAGIDILAVVSRALLDRDHDEAGRFGRLLDALGRAGLNTAAAA